MQVEVSLEELALIRILLDKEESDLRVEMHHAHSSYEYREHLKERHKMVNELLERMKKVIPE